MRRYTFWDAMELIDMNNHTAFETETAKLCIKNGVLSFINKDDKSVRTDVLPTDLSESYELTEKCVGYREALRAYEEGSKIKIVKVNPVTNKLSNYVITSDMDNFEFNLNDMKHGEWYIIK